MRSDLSAGENPRNGTRDTGSQLRNSTWKLTTLWKARIQGPAVVGGRAATTTTRIRTWRAGELEGSGKAFIHDSKGDRWGSNPTWANRCLLVRGIHDLEVTQQASSVSGSSCRWSMMRSSISGGRGHDIVVQFQKSGKRIKVAGPGRSSCRG